MTAEQQVVQLRDEQGKKWTEIGDIIGVSRDAARRMYSRGKGAPGEAPLPQKGDFRRWAKKAEWPAIIEALREGILEDIRSEAYASTPLGEASPPSSVPAGLLLEVAAVDAHFGKLSWQDETGFNWDVKMAVAEYKARIEDIAARAPSFGAIAEIVHIVGNDALQTDNLAGTTTSGTYVDTDTRYIRSFRHARSAHSWAIRRLAEVAPVRVVVIPGNHDRLTAFHLGEVLAAEFADHPRVTVDNSPKLRKYYRYGVNLLGWTHGSEEKVADLPLLMAQEEPELWAETKWREWHIGHLHKIREMRFTAADSFNGVRVRILPALCPPDAWHYQRGFVGEQKATEAYLWHPTAGYVGHLSSNVQLEKAA
jgi:hypothetical protein